MFGNKKAFTSRSKQFIEAADKVLTVECNEIFLFELKLFEVHIQLTFVFMCCV